MDFSELFKFSGIALFSPNGKYLANSAGYRLVIKDVETLQIIQLYSCIDEISHVEWSADSKFVLCAMYKRAAVQVWSVQDSKWKCTIDQGPAGCSFATFSPDGRHILAMAEFQLRITVWSLIHATSIAHIKHPKFSNKGLDFTKHDGGKYMALAERRDCRDYISIIVTDTWELLKHFPVQTRHLSDLKWSPDGRTIAVWDSSLEYNVCIYSPTGNLIAQYSAYDDALGVRKVEWSPSSQLLGIGSYDQKVRILNNLTWRVIAEFDHPEEVKSERTVVFKEVEYAGGILRNETVPVQNKSRYIISELPVLLRNLKIDFNKPTPRMGINMLEWSASNKYMFTRNDNMPNALWVWETAKLSLCALIIQMQSIKCAKWDPVHNRLALCTGNGRVYMWSTEGCSCVDIPAVNFNVHSLKWNSTGDAMVLKDHHSFCCCYPTM